MLRQGVVTKEKLSALSFVFLMLTMSFSASIQAWDFPELESNTPSQVSSGSTVTLLEGFFSTIETNVSTGATGGSFSSDSGGSGLAFSPAGNDADINNSVVVANDYTCIILIQGLSCMGSNDHGQLGIGSNTDSDVMQLVLLGTGRSALSVSALGDHMCAVLDDGSLKCWGHNNYGQLGIGNYTEQNTPQTVFLGTGRTAVSVSVSYSSTCAVLDDGSLKCWGYNNNGELGIGSNTRQNTPQSVYLGVGRTAVSVSTGGGSTCAVLDDGSLKCWGNNGYGQLGIDTQISQNTPQVVWLGAGRTAVSVSNRGSHTCAILDDGSLKCWGMNQYGELGIGSTATVLAPQVSGVNLGNGRTVVSVSATNGHTCAVLDDGSLNCWGYNSHGQLGVGSTITQQTPQSVDLGPGRSALAVYSASQHTCAVLDDYSLKCWGLQKTHLVSNQLKPVHVPAEVASQTRIFASGFSTCAITPSGVLSCRGNGVGYSGLGWENEEVEEIGFNDNHQCVVLSNGSLMCRGSNSYGQLGIGNANTQTTPQIVSLGTGRTAVSVSAGPQHTCAILDDGSLKCWGYNGFGELGLGNYISSFSTPQSVSLGSGRTALSVSAGERHTCAILDDGSLKCWGYNNYGQLGIGSTSSSNSPATVSLGTGRTAVSISSGQQHNCVLLDDGSVKCWGRNYYGQLGIGSNTDQNSPQNVPYGTGKTALYVSVGASHTCAVFDDGSMSCWGRGNNGQLGNGGYGDVNSPSAVFSPDSGEKYTSVSAGSYHTCAETFSNTYCWGHNSYRQVNMGCCAVTTPRESGFGLESRLPFMLSPGFNNQSWYGFPVAGTHNISVNYNTSTQNYQHTATVNVVPPLQYPSVNLSFLIDQNLTAQVPTLIGGPYDISVNPPLPPGLFIDDENGTLTGKPTLAYPAQTYSITVSNWSGQAIVNLTISVVEERPDVTLGVNQIDRLQGFRISPLVLENTGGLIGSSELVSDANGLASGIEAYGSRVVWSDGVACFSTSAGVYCQEGGSNWNQTQAIASNDLAILGENPCSVFASGMVCENASLVNSIGTSVTNYAIDIGGTEENLCVLTAFGSIHCVGEDYTGVERINDDIEPFIELWSSPKTVCGLTVSHALYCWGESSGPNGQASSTDNWLPVKLDIGVDAIASDISLSPDHACALRNSGKAVCWGAGTDGQLGYGFTSDSDTYRVVEVANWVEFEQITTGAAHSCAMNSLGGVMCWGNNSYGQLGDGTTTRRTTPVNVTILPSWLDVVEVHAVRDGTCVVDETYGLWCWGNNANGQLGLNQSITVAATPQPIRFPSSAALYVEGTRNSTLFGAPLVNQSSTSHRWYTNNSGGSDDVNLSISVGVAAVYSQHLFNLTRNTSSVNVQPTLTGGPYQFSIVPELPVGMSIGASNGTIWGMPTQPHDLTNHSIYVENNSGYDQVKIVLQVHDIPPSIVYPSSSYSLVRNWSIEPIIPSAEDGDTERVLVNTPLPEGLQSTSRVSDSAVSTGPSNTCTIRDEILKCWGANSAGQLGIGSYVDQNTPQTVSFGTGRTAVSVSVGDSYACAILDNGSLMCWGSNSGGQLGIGSSVDQNTPQTVSFGTGRTAVSVDTGSVHTCAILDNGSLYCWGYNYYGGLGINSTTQQSTPQHVLLGIGRKAVSVSLGGYHTCAVLDDGSLKCWGYGSLGALGIGSTTHQYMPQTVSVSGGRTVVSVSTGLYHTCAILDDASLKCWGYNTNGQLGLGSTVYRETTPQAVTLGSNQYVVSVSGGSYHTCAVLNDASVKCWGDNAYGQLGIGSFTDQNLPVNVTLETNRTAKSISAGGYQTCAILDDDSLKCWGRNNMGQLGIGNLTTMELPTQVLEHLGSLGPLGTIFGRPLSTSAGQNYTFTANNTYGATNDTVWIEVVPAYDYGNSTLVLTRNQSFSYTPVITGGPYNASFSPALPPGLSFNVTNGTIWGMPTHLTSTNTFILHVSNSTGSDSISLKIYIDDIPPTISYSEKNHTFIRNWTIQDIVPSHENGTIEKVVVSPDLPNGLTNLPKNDVDAQISLKSTNSCTLIGGVVSCWGTTSTTYQPSLSTPQTINFSTGRYAVSVDVGYNGWACSILDNGSVSCWQPISPNSIIPANQVSDSGIVPSGRQAIEVASGFSHRCAILDNFSLVCAGANNQGQLGTSASDGYVDLGAGRTAKKIDLGDTHTCAVLDDGSLKCWGYNVWGQLGLTNAGFAGGTNSYSSPQTVPLPSGRTALDVSTGKMQTCVLLDNFSIMCAGYNFYGELGFGNLSNYAFLDYVNTPNGVTPSVLFSSEYRTCFISDESELYCWGRNDYSEFGTSTSDKFTSPTLIDVGEDVIKADTGESHICVMVLNGSVKCWGRNHRGQLGLGTSTDMSTPTTVPNFDTAPPLLAGSIYGRPVTTTQRTNYTLTANNTFGLSNDTISIEVLTAYDYGNETIWLTRNQTMTHRSPIITGGPYTATIWPPVPSGLFWNASNGTFWGTPSMNQTWTEYYINVSNSTGRDTIIVKIGIGDIVPYVTYTNTTMTYIRGFMIDDELPTHLGGHITTVETYPALPEGLSISDPSTWTSSRPNGTIHGIPTELAAATVYQIWFNNSIGSYVVNLTIDVIPSYDYGNGTISLTRNETMTARSPIITGGPYTTVQLNGALPPGLFFNATNGTVWGTPSTVVSTTQFIVYVANAWGEDEVFFNITVADVPPILEYNLAAMSYRRGFFSEHPYPILTGGEVATYEISNSLPPGLMFNDSNGFISGVPTTVWNASVFTVWANNSLGSSSWNLTIEVLAGITHPSTNVVYVRNQTIQAYEPIINIVERNLSITPPLPQGLTFNLQNGTITGSSLIPWTPIEHSIHLWNATGEDWLNVTIVVHEILPDVGYDSSLTEALNQFGIVPLLPNGTGGTPVEWSADFKGLEGLHILHNATETTLSGFGNTLCMISSDEEVLCWGANDMGQLGQGHATATTGVQSVLLTSEGTPRDIDVGTAHVCVVLSSGQIDCWGQNDQGQLGQDFACVYGSFSDGCNGNFAVPQSGQAVNPTSGNFTQVSVGKAHTCALHENGQVYCWGDNSDGQLGLGTTQSVSVPTLVNTLVRFTSIDTGDAHTCGIDEQGEVWCWGRNAFGQLGDSTTTSQNLPAKAQLPPGYSAKSISVGAEHSCAILNESQPACWGRNSQGQLGDGTILGKITPRIVPGSVIGQVLSIEAGPAQTCVVNASAGVWCWGASTSGAFLSNSGNALSPISVETPFGLSIHNIAVGEGQLCSISSRSTLLCRGTNQQGQLLGETVPQRSNFSEWFVETIALSHHPAGTVYGRPSNGTGTYILQLNVSNIIGTHSFNHSIQVMDALSLGLSRIEMIRNTTTTPIQPSTSTYALGTFYIEPTLPSGLMFNSTTGEISGRPNVNMTLTSYAMIFANEFGHDERMFDLIIYEPAADVVYPGLDIQLIRGESSLDWIPVVSNGSVETWGIVPNLPDGLVFENGVLKGTPIINSTSTVYRIYANNTGGVTFVDINITVVEPRPVLLVGSNEYTFTRQSAISAILIANTGGFVEQWSIEPDLPEGLTFIDGVLSGTPSVNMTLTTFTISAQNSGGTFVRSINITVLEPVPILESSATDVVFVRGEPITSIDIINNGGMVANWTISPSLPDGLLFKNGVLSGTPEVNSTLQIYTIAALNSGGQATFSLEIEVVEPLPEFNYTEEEFILSRNTPFEAIVPVSDGGQIASWTISPTLPSGLFFDERRGVIQGLAVSTSPFLVYTIVAENSGGQTIGYLSIEVRNPAPSFTLPSNELAIVEGQEMNRFTPFVASGDVVNSWELSIEGAELLPEGLVFDLTTGALSGRPSKGATILELTIVATNDGGSSSASLNLSILADFDGDGIANINDEDDDNDGYSDIEEQSKDSNPMDSTSTPIEGFEFIIPNTEISLGAWDIIGMFTGIPLIVWLSFSLVTRNKRTQTFVDDMNNAKTREELETVAERYEKAIMWKLIGPHHGMRLERLRAEADDAIEERDRAFKYKLEESAKEEEARKELGAEFFDEVDQTPLVEKAEKGDTSEQDEDEKIGEVEPEQGEDAENTAVEDVSAPDPSEPATSIDEIGYEWLVVEEGTSFYRTAGSSDPWVKYEN